MVITFFKKCPLRLAAVCLWLLFLPAQVACAQNGPVVGAVPQNVPTQFIERPSDLQVETWITGLEAPWSLVFLPDGRALVSERPGRVRLIEEGELLPKPYLELDVANVGEGGLMGLAVHPDFAQDSSIYAMYTYRDNGALFNRVQRFRHAGNHAEPGRIVIDRIPGSRFHNGGRLGFGPDGKLYITAGENFQAHRAQDLSSLAGSILRLNPDGSIPEDNPFRGSPIWSYGHRNPQGLAWHGESGALFASEHGPSGEFGLHGHDMVNVIEKGTNYGWPLEVGVGGLKDYEDPLIMWQETTPPSGMAFWRGQLYVATLRSEALLRIRLEPEGGSFRVASIQGLFARERFQGTYGRLRAAVVGPDKTLYVLTSNRDGRGSPRPGDDRVLRILPQEEMVDE